MSTGILHANRYIEACVGPQQFGHSHKYIFHSLALLEYAGTHAPFFKVWLLFLTSL